MIVEKGRRGRVEKQKEVLCILGRENECRIKIWHSFVHGERIFKRQKVWDMQGISF